MTVDNKFSYSGVQTLRFVAAFLVVVTHTTLMISERVLGLSDNSYWRPGMSGVDIFFVISGFVMIVSTEKLLHSETGWKEFLKKRFIRIVPLYWTASTIKVFLLLIVPSIALHTALDAKHILSSYLLIPTFDHESKLIFPILIVGWTLMYEAFFYLLFAASLYLKKPPLIFISSILIILSLFNVISDKSLPIAYGFFNPIMLEFVMGMIIAKFRTKKVTISSFITILILLVSIFTILSTGSLPIWWRWLYWGLPAALIVWLAVVHESKLKATLPKFLSLLGDSSYSLYLFHTFSIPFLGIMFHKLHVVNLNLIFAVCVLTAPMVGILAYVFLEKPILSFFKNDKKN